MRNELIVYLDENMKVTKILLNDKEIKEFSAIYSLSGPHKLIIHYPDKTKKTYPLQTIKCNELGWKLCSVHAVWYPKYSSCPECDKL